MASLQKTGARCLLALALLLTPAGAPGHYVCSLGMSQAGPGCPVCHGNEHVGQVTGGAALRGECCTYVSQADADASVLPAVTAAHPGSTVLAFLTPPMPGRLLFAPAVEPPDVSHGPPHSFPTLLAPLRL